MSVTSLSFWQQNQRYYSHKYAQSRFATSSAALMSVMGDAVTNLSTGLSRIANQTALNRTNAALSAALQAAISGSAGNSGSSAKSSSSASTGTSSSSASSSKASSATNSSGISNNSAPALLTNGTAEILLASNGSAGSLLNLLA